MHNIHFFFQNALILSILMHFQKNIKSLVDIIDTLIYTRCFLTCLAQWDTFKEDSNACSANLINSLSNRIIFCSLKLTYIDSLHIQRQLGRYGVFKSDKLHR